jgi:hypothetical protein
MGGPCSGNEREEERDSLLVGKSKGKRPIGKPRRRWLYNIRMYLGEVGWGDVDWTGLAQDRRRHRAHVNSTLNFCFL